MTRKKIVLSLTILLLSGAIATYYTLSRQIMNETASSIALALFIPVAAAIGASGLWVTRPQGENHQKSGWALYIVATLLTAFTVFLAFSPIFLNWVIYHELRVYMVGIAHLRDVIFGRI